MNWSFLGLFGAGLATFLSPCVLPLAPVLVASWATASSSKWGRVLSTAWFALGFTITFVALGATASAVTILIAPFKPALFLAGAIILTLFALRMMGFLKEVRWFAWLERSVHLPDLSAKVPRSLAGLVFGLIFGISWTPCVGPVLGAVLTYVASQQSSPARGAIMLFVFSLGISLPLLVLAAAFERGRLWLTRFRAYIPRVEYAMGFGMLVFAITLFNQARLGGEPIAVADDPVEATDHSQNLISLGARTAGQARMVFFYSDNCPVCHAMERYLPKFEKDCASSAFKFSKVNVDLPENRAAAARFQVRAVPTLSLLSEDGKELFHLVGYQTEGRLREAARAVSGLLCKQEPAVAPEAAPLFEPSQSCDVGKSC